MGRQIKACYCSRHKAYMNFNSKEDACDLKLKCTACKHASDFREDYVE